MATYTAAYRDIDIRATITLRTGTQFTVTSTDIYSYTADSTAASSGIPLGEAVSGSFSLSVTVSACPYSAEQLDGAEVRMSMGVRNDTTSSYTYTDAGAWYVTNASSPEGSSAITLKGIDALGVFFDGIYNDDASNYPTTMGDLLALVCAIAGVALKTKTFFNSDVVISTRPSWGDETSLRNIVGYIAACAAGFAQIDQSGKLEIITDGQGTKVNLDGDIYNQFTPEGGSHFAFNCIRVTLPPASEDDTEGEIVRVAIDSDIADDASNCVAVDNNPLITEALAATVRDKLNGVKFEGYSVNWLGDPAVMCGHIMELTALDGVKHKGLVTSRKLTFDGGLSMTLTSAMPAMHSTSSHYTSAGRLFNSDGTLPVYRVAGMSGAVVKAMLGKFDRIIAGDITTDTLFARIAKIVELSVQIMKADTIDAKIIKTGSLDATKITAGSITADRIAAGAITAESGIIANGAIGTAQIADGSITEGKVVSLNADVIKTGTLSADRLLLAGDNGVIYKINATSAGLSMTELAEDQYKNYINGTVIVAKSITAAQIAAKTLTGNEILAGSITSAEINVAELFASEATIQALNAMDISGNGYLKLYVTNAVDSIQVGGVNLLRNTGDLKISDYDFDASGADAMGSYSEEDEGFRIVCASQNVRWWLGVLPVTPGAQYGMSVRYRMNSGAAPVEFQYVYRNSSHEAVYYQTSANAVQTVRTEDGWTVLMDVITVPSVSDITEVRLAVRTGEDYKLYTCDYSIKKPKFEVGNRVTDWSPAPKDTDEDITSLRSEINLIPGKITLAVNEVQVGGTNLIKTAMDDLISVSVGSKWRDDNKTYYQQSGLGMRMEPHTGEYNILHFLSPVLLSPGNYMLSFWCWTYAIDIQPTVRCNLWNGKERDHYFRDIKPTANDPVKYEIPVSVDYTDSMYLRFVVPEQWTAGYIYFTDVKLEKGSRATDWSPNPEEFRAGSAVTLTEDEVRISTPEFNVEIVSDDGETNMLSIDKDGARMQSLVAPDVAPRYNGPTALFVNKSATSEQIASGNYYRSLADALAALSNRWIGNDVEVSVAAGTVEYGTVTLQGTAGSGMITITGDLTNHAKLVGKLRVVYSGCPVVLQNMNVDSMSGNVGIECAGSQTMVIVENCVITGKGVGATGGRGVLAFRGAKADVHSCELYDHERALYAQQAGAIQAYDCKGNCKIGVSSGIIHASGTMPDTTTTFAPAKWAGEVFASNVSVDQGSRPSTEAEPTTVNVTASATDSWYSASGAWLNQDNVIRQGYYSGMGEWSGCFWFPTASFSGKTIKTGSLTLTRTAGSGKSGEVTLTLYGITVASASGDPNSGRVSYGALGTIANGETKPFTLPAAAAQALANGTIKGFMLCANDGAVMSGRKYSTNYCKIGSAGGTLPQLSVTY